MVKHRAQEMMFGWRHHFTYQECHGCGTLQLVNPPDDMAAYYPAEYYSYRMTSSWSGLKKWLKKWHVRHILGRKNIIGFVLSRNFAAPFNVSWFRRSNVNEASKIVDVGAGSGWLLAHLKLAGFTSICGADPYIESDYSHPYGFLVYKKELEQLEGEFDLIMMHHTFEHILDPVNFLKKAKKKLSPEGVVLLRIPLADSYAWKNYGVNWFQLDAPRHIHLFTKKAIKTLADLLGYELIGVEYDSEHTALLYSQLYEKNMSLMEAGDIKKHFKSNEIEEAKQLANALNSKELGDQACFFLRVKPNMQ